MAPHSAEPQAFRPTSFPIYRVHKMNQSRSNPPQSILGVIALLVIRGIYDFVLNSPRTFVIGIIFLLSVVVPIVLAAYIQKPGRNWARLLLILLLVATLVSGPFVAQTPSEFFWPSDLDESNYPVLSRIANVTSIVTFVIVALMLMMKSARDWGVEKASL